MCWSAVALSGRRFFSFWTASYAGRTYAGTRKADLQPHHPLRRSARGGRFRRSPRPAAPGSDASKPDFRAGGILADADRSRRRAASPASSQVSTAGVAGIARRAVSSWMNQTRRARGWPVKSRMPAMTSRGNKTCEPRVTAIPRNGAATSRTLSRAIADPNTDVARSRSAAVRRRLCIACTHRRGGPPTPLRVFRCSLPQTAFR